MLRALVAFVVLAAVACGGESRTAPETAENRSGDSTLAGATLDGEFVSLDQFRGRPVLVNVWSSW